MNPNQSLMEAVLAADEAGLSYGQYMAAYGAGRPSLPARGAWIEISRFTTTTTSSQKSLPARGAWIEMW